MGGPRLLIGLRFESSQEGVAELALGVEAFGQPQERREAPIP